MGNACIRGGATSSPPRRAPSSDLQPPAPGQRRASSTASSGGILSGLTRRGGATPAPQTRAQRLDSAFAEVNNMLNNVQAQRTARSSAALGVCENDLHRLQGEISAAVYGADMPSNLSQRMTGLREQLSGLQEMTLDSEVVHHSGELDTTEYLQDRTMTNSGELDPSVYSQFEGR
ncbi:hypothetical protein [Acidovorax sp. NCPPB 3576]|uniref:hypothetical protein n=1 Tax=Acidovorax sp. NCPPB 3576 TaxID=2940488 RepID=UPI0023497DA7|nr:hypothetical protein [Acidovorax sp. NCPPB 3576]WCM89620.1 hypothetical protein M5C98_06130 [Acidovorax sp. NCPPB 3576]